MATGTGKSPHTHTHTRRKYALVKTVEKSVDYERSLLCQTMLQIPDQRLQSRRPRQSRPAEH